MLDDTSDPQRVPPHDDWLDLQTAREQLMEHIARFLTTSSGQNAWDEHNAPPVLGLKVSAGLGKTRTALECIAKQGHEFLKKGHILFYVPTLDLAVEAEKTFRELNSDHPSFLLRGRSAINPGTAAAMCARSDVAKEIAKNVSSVTRALCREETRGGKIVEAACAKGCPYLAQEAITKPHVVFLAHSYLNSKPPLSCPVALRIIDEKFWKEMIDIETLPHDDWMFTPDHLKDEALKKCYIETQETVSAALRDKKPVHLALRDKEITAKSLRDLATAERLAMPVLELDPGLPENLVRLQIASFDHAKANSIKVRSLVFNLLARTIGRGGTERLSLAKPTEQSGNRALIKVHQLDEIPVDAPILLLDADLDETIVSRFCANAKFERLLTRPKAHVIQVSDQTLAYSTLKGEEHKERRDDIVRIIKREVERARKKDVLVVAPKAVLHKLYEDNGETFNDRSTQPQMLHGATVRWFGPRLLGVNTYSDFATIILVGRLQLPVVALEDQLRALFGDSDMPLSFTDGERLMASKTSLLRADDTRVDVKVRSHPDPRGAALLRQSREAQSEQAIARLRLLSTDTPKRVLVLSNVPLPGLPVNDWLKFDAVVQDKSDVQVSKKYQKLERAIDGANGPVLRGIRLSPGGLTKDAKNVFPSLASAKEFRKELPTEVMLEWVESIAADRGLSATSMRLSNSMRGGHKTHAVVFTTAKGAQQLSQHLWPEFDKHTVSEERPVIRNDETAVLEPLS